MDFQILVRSFHNVYLIIMDKVRVHIFWLHLYFINNVCKKETVELFSVNFYYQLILRYRLLDPTTASSIPFFPSIKI